jgi:hypothetical protein
MKLSDDRINYLSHQIAEAIAADELVVFKDDWNKVRLGIRRGIAAALRKEQEIVGAAEARIRSLKRNVPEGGPEWDALFRNYYTEGIDKLRSIR